jgi:hypothetical protein
MHQLPMHGAHGPCTPPIGLLLCHTKALAKELGLATAPRKKPKADRAATTYAHIPHAWACMVSIGLVPTPLAAPMSYQCICQGIGTRDGSAQKADSRPCGRHKCARSPCMGMHGAHGPCTPPIGLLLCHTNAFAKELGLATAPRKKPSADRAATTYAHIPHAWACMGPMGLTPPRLGCSYVIPMHLPRNWDSRRLRAKSRVPTVRPAQMRTCPMHGHAWGPWA